MRLQYFTDRGQFGITYARLFNIHQSGHNPLHGFLPGFISTTKRPAVQPQEFCRLFAPNGLRPSTQKC
jgi:hypothetical protein